jgi:hypothetical protein
MHKKLLLAAFAFVFAYIGFAQTVPVKTERPDFIEIEKAIKDKNGPFFYTALMGRYTKNDTTLTIEEYKYLYYGFSFQDNYSPYGKASVSDELKDKIAKKETDKIIELEKRLLVEFPFNLRNLSKLTNELDKKGEVEEANMYYKKLLGIAKAIMSTGDGRSDSTAMYVISVEHEYDMISLLDFKFGGSQSLVRGKYGSMDKMKLDKNDDNIEALYFNVDRLFASMEKLFRKKD